MNQGAACGCEVFANGTKLHPPAGRFRAILYLVSRSICQGRKAGLISLGGVGLGFLVYMVAAALGITALLFAVPPPRVLSRRFSGHAPYGW